MPTSCERVFKLPRSTEVWANMVVSSSEYVPKILMDFVIGVNLLLLQYSSES